jgi:hypothetical protein
MRVLRNCARGAKLRAMSVPNVRYAKSGNVNIAYQVIGDGPFDLFVVLGAASHVEHGGTKRSARPSSNAWGALRACSCSISAARPLGCGGRAARSRDANGRCSRGDGRRRVATRSHPRDIGGRTDDDPLRHDVSGTDRRDRALGGVVTGQRTPYTPWVAPLEEGLAGPRSSSARGERSSMAPRPSNASRRAVAATLRTLAAGRAGRGTARAREPPPRSCACLHHGRRSHRPPLDFERLCGGGCAV